MLVVEGSNERSLCGRESPLLEQHASATGRNLPFASDKSWPRAFKLGEFARPQFLSGLDTKYFCQALLRGAGGKRLRMSRPAEVNVGDYIQIDTGHTAIPAVVTLI